MIKYYMEVDYRCSEMMWFHGNDGMVGVVEMSCAVDLEVSHCAVGSFFFVTDCDHLLTHTLACLVWCFRIHICTSSFLLARTRSSPRPFV
jgi:hypothetical protein